MVCARGSMYDCLSVDQILSLPLYCFAAPTSQPSCLQTKTIPEPTCCCAVSIMCAPLRHNRPKVTKNLSQLKDRARMKSVVRGARRALVVPKACAAATLHDAL